MAERNEEQQHAGAETGTNRSSEHYERGAGHHNTIPEQQAHVGGVTTRTPAGGGQGISNRSADQEDKGQERVVEERPDAQAGLNSLRKKAS